MINYMNHMKHKARLNIQTKIANIDIKKDLNWQSKLTNQVWEL